MKMNSRNATKSTSPNLSSGRHPQRRGPRPSRTLDSVASIQPLRQGRDSLVFPQINYSWCLRQQKGRLRSSQSASTILLRVPAEPAVTPLAKSHPRLHQTSSRTPRGANGGTLATASCCLLTVFRKISQDPGRTRSLVGTTQARQVAVLPLRPAALRSSARATAAQRPRARGRRSVREAEEKHFRFGGQ